MKDIVIQKLIPLDNIFDEQWLKERPELQYPLSKNQKYREEVNNWLHLFDAKKWLDDKLIKRLQNANTWTSYYSKINELRAGYFFEKKLNFVLSAYEVSTIDNKNVEFKGRVNGVDVFIEVKTPLHLKKKRSGWLNINGPWRKGDIIYEIGKCLDKATKQLPDNAQSIVVLSDDFNVSLFDCVQHILDNICILFDSYDYQKISALCILGDIYYENMYQMMWTGNDNTNHPISEDIFKGYNKIFRFM